MSPLPGTSKARPRKRGHAKRAGGRKREHAKRARFRKRGHPKRAGFQMKNCLPCFFTHKNLFLNMLFGSVFMSYKCAKSTGDHDTFPLKK